MPADHSESLSERLVRERRERGEHEAPAPLHVPVNEREPRAMVSTTFELVTLLEAPEPVLGLFEDEVQCIVGKPPNLETGEGYDPGLPGVRYYARLKDLTYLRADGRVLRYVYEGLGSWGLVTEEAR